MTTSQVLAHFNRYTFFTRDLLYYFVRRKGIKYNSLQNGSRDFTPESLSQIGLLLEAYARKKETGPSDLTQLSAPSVSDDMPDTSVWPNETVVADGMKLASLTDPLGLGASSDFCLQSVTQSSVLEVLARVVSAGSPRRQSELQQLTTAACEAIFDELSYAALLRTLADGVRDLFGVEATELFLVNPHDADEFVLGARSSTPDGSTPSSRQIGGPIRVSSSLLSESLGGVSKQEAALISSHIFDRDERSTYLEARDWAHLRQPLACLLRIAVRNRKGRIIGRWEIENPQTNAGFSDDDLALAEIVGQVGSVLLETANTLAAIKRIGDSIVNGFDLQRVFDEILWTGQWLTGADRGDIAVYSAARSSGGRDDLIIISQRGESCLEIGKGLPSQSVLSHLWMKKKTGGMNKAADRIDDVRRRPYYYPADGFTRSEVAVCVGDCIVNLESIRPASFDDIDECLLTDLACCASEAASRLSRSTPLAPNSPQLMQRDDWLHLLGPVLDAVVPDPAEAAILYVCDDARRLLRIGATLRCAGTKINPGDFSYHYDETSLATKVRRERRPYVSVVPENDPNVHPIYSKFQLRGPLVGTPLIYGRDVVGVLVLGRPEGGAPGDSANHRVNEMETRLQVLAPSLAVSIQKLESDFQRRLMFLSLYRILQSAQTETSLESKLMRVLAELVANGFDRCRLFRWDSVRAKFVGWLSVGMKNPELFCGLEIDPNVNPFAQETIAQSLSNPVAHRYQPIYQRDPDTKRLEKDENLPWACAGIVLSEKRLWGQVVCDCAYSAREMGRDNLEFLTVVAALAAQIIAGHEGGRTNKTH